MSGVSFRMFRGFYEKRIFPTRKRMFAISPDRIGEKSDPNLGLEWWTKYDYFARFKGEACQKNTKNHRCKNKTMNISWGFSLRIEISGKGCVYHNLPWVFNSYVLLRGGGGESKISWWKTREERKKDPSPRSQDKFPGSAGLWPEGNNKGPIEGWQVSGSTPFGA